MLVEEKPDIREQIGTAVNASVLSLKEDRETPLLRIAAMGAAAASMTSKDRRDALVSDLAPLLWRIRGAKQYASLPQAVDLYAEWLVHRRNFAGLSLGIRQAFAARILTEWLSALCRYCRGTGRLERLRDGTIILPRAVMQRNAVYRTCQACGGSGQKRPRPAERTRALGIRMREYDSQKWEHKFKQGMIWLMLIESRFYPPLTNELERRKRW